MSGLLGDIQCCGARKEALDTYSLRISPSCPTPHPVTLELSITDNSGHIWTSSFTITVYISSQISGYVRAAAGALESATIEYRGPISGEVRTDQSGHYSFSVINGIYTLSAKHDDYLPGSSQEVIVPPDAEGVDFYLKRPAIIVSPLSLEERLSPQASLSL